MNTLRIKGGAVLLGFCYVITTGEDENKVSHCSLVSQNRQSYCHFLLKVILNKNINQINVVNIIIK